MPILIGLVILLTGAVLLAKAGFRARRMHNPLLRWGAVGLASLLATALAALSVLVLAGTIRLQLRHAPAPNLKVTNTPARIQPGQAIANSFCGSCHTSAIPLAGGVDIGKHLPISVGSFVSANLTPAGRLSHWSDGQIFRAIRNGIDAEGHWLTIMSYTNAGKLSDDDTESVITYLRSLSAAGSATAKSSDHLNLLGVILLGAGVLPSGKPVFAGVITAPPKGPNARFGEYIASYADCRECHGASLSGGVPGQMGPVGPNLNLVRAWSLQGFIDTMRTGTDPWGHHLSEQMPWRPLGKMDDEELAALYEYLTHLPGSRSTLAAIVLRSSVTAVALPFDVKPPCSATQAYCGTRQMEAAMHTSSMLRKSGLVAVAAVGALCVQPPVSRAEDARVARGRYLVRIGGCNDCHTPGYFLGKPDASRFLSGSDVGFPLPDGRVVVGRNLTPDKETGIGSWTIEQIATAIRTGVRPDGRVLAPIMPYASYAYLTPSDVTAIALFLKTLPPVRHQIPGPFAANEKPTVFHWQLVPPQPPTAGLSDP